MKKKHICSLLLFSICIYLFFAAFSFQKPIVADEVEYMTGCPELGLSMVIHTYKDSPGPKYRIIYPYILALLFRTFDVNPEVARLPGALSFLLTLILIYGLSIEIFLNRPNKEVIGLSACLLYALHPMVIQGSLILGVDNTILTPMIYLFIYAFIKTRNSSIFRRVLCLIIVLTMILWCKPTPLPFLVITVAIFSIIERGFRKGGYEVSIIFGIGVCTYLLLWWIYSELKDLPFILPLINITGHISCQHIPGTLFNRFYDLSLRIARLMTWVSPFFILLCIIALGARVGKFWKERKSSLIDLLLIYFWAVFVGYILIGGITFGFPRYHFSMLPALAIISSYTIFKFVDEINKKHLILSGILIPLIIIYDIIYVGDLVYSVNFKLKESLLFYNISTKIAVLKYLCQLILYLLPLIFSVVILKIVISRDKLIKIAILSLFICSIAASISLDVIQGKAKYNVGYEYGGVGYKEVIDFLVTQLRPNDVIIANESIVYNFNSSANSNSPYFSPSKYNEKESLINTINALKPAAIVYGITLNTVEQINQVFKSKEVQGLLQRHFQKTTIGSNTIWIRQFHNKNDVI